MSLRTKLAGLLLRGLHPRDPALVDLFGGMMSSAGVAVTADSAMRVAAVYSSIRVISETLASLPLILYRRKPGGGKERATDHWAYPLLHSRPNGWMTSMAWREMGTAHMNLRGVCYTRIVGDRRGKVQLIPMHPDATRCVQLDSGKLAYEHRQKNGTSIVLLQDEVIRVPFMTLDGLNPITPITCQRETIGTALASQDHHNRFWANDARPRGGWIEVSADFKDDGSREKFRDQWAKHVGGANSGKVAFLKKGMTYHPFQMATADVQYIESQKLSRSQIAGIFRVPPHMIGDLERATFTNIEQQTIDFVVHCLTPWAKRWEQELVPALLGEGAEETYYVEHLFDGLLRGDAAARANYFRTAILTGWMSRNEVREIENMNKAVGLDEYLSPLNMAPADLLAEAIKAKVSNAP